MQNYARHLECIKPDTILDQAIVQALNTIELEVFEFYVPEVEDKFVTDIALVLHIGTVANHRFLVCQPCWNELSIGCFGLVIDQALFDLLFGLMIQVSHAFYSLTCVAQPGALDGNLGAPLRDGKLMDTAFTMSRLFRRTIVS